MTLDTLGLIVSSIAGFGPLVMMAVFCAAAVAEWIYDVRCRRAAKIRTSTVIEIYMGRVKIGSGVIDDRSFTTTTRLQLTLGDMSTASGSVVRIPTMELHVTKCLEG